MSATDLLVLATELVDVASVSRQETALADRVVAALADCPWLEVERAGDNVVARTSLGRPQRLLLAGHLDTVPPSGNAVPRLDGDVLWGVGAADMKGGLAVMLELARLARRPAVDLTWCFYACEEVSREENGLTELWARRPDLLAADAAVLGEPTAGLVEAGCQGAMRVQVRVGGVRAHPARPFTGRNAIHRLGPFLDRVRGWEGRSVVLDGCEYTEQLQAVAVEGGVAGNVVPDHASLTLSYRYAPDRHGPEADEFIAALFDGLPEPEAGDEVRVLDRADGAPPALDHPLLAALVERTGADARAKVGWTDVASFWAHGVPAANFGPGDPLLAHHPDERVGRAALESCLGVLAGLVGVTD